MKKLLFVAALAAFALGAARPASATTTMTTCPFGFVVANDTLILSGQSEFGVQGNVWAISSSSMQVVVLNIGAGRYCVQTRETGSFTTIPGATSPGGTGTEAGATPGSLARTQVFVAAGTWNPQVPTSGYVGAYTGSLDPVALFVTGVTDERLTWYVGQFRTSTSCWGYRLDIGSIGDII
jgi:hypothetical protein